MLNLESYIRFQSARIRSGILSQFNETNFVVLKQSCYVAEESLKLTIFHECSWVLENYLRFYIYLFYFILNFLGRGMTFLCRQNWLQIHHPESVGFQVKSIMLRTQTAMLFGPVVFWKHEWPCFYRQGKQSGANSAFLLGSQVFVSSLKVHYL